MPVSALLKLACDLSIVSVSLVTQRVTDACASVRVDVMTLPSPFIQQSWGSVWQLLTAFAFHDSFCTLNIKAQGTQLRFLAPCATL